MNILYSGDANTKKGILLSAMSLCENSGETINVYILTANAELQGIRTIGIEKEFGRYLDKVLKESDPCNSAELIDISSFFKAEFPLVNKDTRFTASCMLRLFADLVPLPERLLYLDYDVLCVRNISELERIDISGAEIGGVLDCFGRYFYDPEYLNSGVLLLNMPEIKKSALFANCRRLCREKKMLLPDQSALNKLAKKKLILPRCYNEQKKSRSDTALRHFSTTFEFFPVFRKVTVKPWDLERMHSVLGLYEHDDIIMRGLKLYKKYEGEKHEDNTHILCG